MTLGTENPVVANVVPITGDMNGEEVEEAAGTNVGKDVLNGAGAVCGLKVNGAEEVV